MASVLGYLIFIGIQRVAGKFSTLSPQRWWNLHVQFCLRFTYYYNYVTGCSWTVNVNCVRSCSGAEGGSAISQAQMLEVTTAMFSGFLMYKVAVLAVTLTPTDPVDVGSVVKNNVSGEN
jgi:hypothetical protein